MLSLRTPRSTPSGRGLGPLKRDDVTEYFLLSVAWLPPLCFRFLDKLARTANIERGVIIVYCNRPPVDSRAFVEVWPCDVEFVLLAERKSDRNCRTGNGADVEPFRLDTCLARSTWATMSPSSCRASTKISCAPFAVALLSTLC